MILVCLTDLGFHRGRHPSPKGVGLNTGLAVFMDQACLLFGIWTTRQANVKGECKSRVSRVPVVAQWLTNLTRNHEVAGSVPGLDRWVNHPALL